MESTFIEWLNHCMNGAGTAVAVGVVIGGAIFGLVTFLHKVIVKHDDDVKTIAITEKEDEDFKTKMSDVSKSVDKLSDNIQVFMDQQTTHNDKIDKQLDTLSDRITEQKEESIRGDKLLSDKINAFEKTTQQINEDINSLNQNMSLIIDSDKESIKSFIVTEYYKAKHNKFVELFIMETLENRYKKYLQENGDTFVAGLMDELRLMPKGQESKKSNSTNNRKPRKTNASKSNNIKKDSSKTN